ncbi:MAG: putative bifunctional diguanylate cyclase/phosphodiesterase [Gemmatimonadota bacterium]
MSRSDPRRRAFSTFQAVLAALLAGAGLFLVPTLALSGLPLAAVIAGVVWIGGGVAFWILYRRGLRHENERLEREQATRDLYRLLVEHGGEGHLVLDSEGAITFVSPNVQGILGLDPDRLVTRADLIDLLQGRDRRRALRAWVRVRRSPGASASLEAAVRGQEDGRRHVAVRAVNLTDSAGVAGILVTVRDITPRKRFETEIRHLAYYDELTGLANRRFFFEQGTRALSLARRHGHALAVLYLDLDRFKQINDFLGHERGDAVLREVGESLAGVVRESDLVARLSGDEFAVVLTEVRDAEAAGRVAHRILDHLPATTVAEGHEIPLEASIGVAIYPEDAENLETLVNAADVAMYRAKSAGTGIYFYRPGLRRALSEELRLEQDMRLALEHHEFRLHYQPVFELATGAMVGAEALSRWRHFTRGLVAASDFIQLAERAGLLGALDRWAVGRALQQRAALESGRRVGWVGVNLSPRSCRDRELAAYVRAALEAAGFEPGALVLEVPEAMAARFPELTADLMWELKDAGAAVALDGYGAGALSFPQLKRLPVDIVKLHADLVAGVGTGESDEHLVEAAITIAHGVRARVLAQGVEREAQVDWLREAGCDLVQGYLVGTPVPVEELAGGGRGRVGEPVR